MAVPVTFSTRAGGAADSDLAASRIEGGPGNSVAWTLPWNEVVAAAGVDSVVWVFLIRMDNEEILLVDLVLMITVGIFGSEALPVEAALVVVYLALLRDCPSTKSDLYTLISDEASIIIRGTMLLLPSR